MAYKGKYKVLNKSKYKGDPTNVIYRSLWERKLMNYLDTNPRILEWSSEEIAIPYNSPVDGRTHRYFPDFWAKIQTNEGVEIKVLEVKPLRQTLPPKVPKRKTKRYYQDLNTWLINESKFNAAIEECKKRGWKFQILTERNLKPGDKY